MSRCRGCRGSRRAKTQLGRAYDAGAPVVADGMVFVTSYSLQATTGELETFPQSCGTPRGLSCKPVWTAAVGADASTSPAVADGEVFVDTDGGKGNDTQELWAFGVHCGTDGATCSPTWTATVKGTSFEDEAPLVSGGVVYIPTGGVETSYLNAYPVTCTTPCQPLWRGKTGAGAGASASAGYGFVYIPDYDGYLYAFKAGCASGGKTCSPAWFGSVEEGGPRGAAVDDGLVFIGSQNGDLFAFKARGCGSSSFPCPPVWVDVTHRNANILADPAVAYGLVFVTDYVNRYLYAFPEHCRSSSCKPVWQALLSHQDLSDPVVANGVVYVGLGNNERNVGMDAFSVHCATGGGLCTPLCHARVGYYIPAGPVVAGGEVWAGGGPINGPADLYAFGLPVPRSGRA